VVFLAKSQFDAALATQVFGFLESLEIHSALLPNQQVLKRMLQSVGSY
jgi:hypothetical protein